MTLDFNIFGLGAKVETIGDEVTRALGEALSISSRSNAHIFQTTITCVIRAKFPFRAIVVRVIVVRTTASIEGILGYFIVTTASSISAVGAGYRR